MGLIHLIVISSKAFGSQDSLLSEASEWVYNAFYGSSGFCLLAWFIAKWKKPALSEPAGNIFAAGTDPRHGSPNNGPFRRSRTKKPLGIESVPRGFLLCYLSIQSTYYALLVFLMIRGERLTINGRLQAS